MLDARCPDRGGGSFVPACPALARHKRFSLPDAFSGLIYSIFCIFLSFDALIESFASIICVLRGRGGGQRAWRLSITLDDGTRAIRRVSVGGCMPAAEAGGGPAGGIRGRYKSGTNPVQIVRMQEGARWHEMEQRRR